MIVISLKGSEERLFSDELQKSILWVVNLGIFYYSTIKMQSNSRKNNEITDHEMQCSLVMNIL